MQTVYFDNAATTFPKPEEVYQNLDQTIRIYGVNSGRGGYALARKASQTIDDTRMLLAQLVGLNDSSKVILTSSATVALNTVLLGIEWNQNDNVYYSPFEHNSTLRPLQVLKNKYDINLIQIPVNKTNLQPDLDQLSAMFSKAKPKLVAISHASNVCGVIMPIKEITFLAHKYEAQVLIDGSQTLGLIPMNIKDIGCDYYVFAGHKNLYGPFGIGGIFINTSTMLEPFITGGTGSNSEDMCMPDEYPLRLEAGSPNVIAIAGLNAGLYWIQGQADLLSKERLLLKRFFEIVEEYPEIKVIGIKEPENMVPVVSCTFDGYVPQEIAMILDQNFNIAVRAGLHCAPLAHKFFGTSPLGTVRFSLGAFTSSNHLDHLIEAFANIYS